MTYSSEWYVNDVLES